jgi:hypothetical protein
VAGSAEVWSALRLVAECLCRGEVAQAQGILDAAGLNVPDGRVARSRRAGGVFDERGVGYEVPAWVVRDPEDVVEDAGEEGEKRKGREEEEGGDFIGEVVVLRARLSDRSMDVVVKVGMGQTATVVSKEICKKIGPRRVRLLYLGQVWAETKTLEELGYKEGDVVSAFVFDE